jgi:SAM-dependent methyltransferase
MAMYREEYVRIRQLVRSGSVLDVGCGVGDFLNIFEDSAWVKYGIDVSPYALQLASQKHVITTLPNQCDEFFDLIVFRGTLQHLDEPIVMLKRCVRWLKPGGIMVFLATPNIGGPCYRMFEELPMLDPSRNFMLVSDTILRHILENLGLTVLKFHFPYRGTPYARPWRDCIRFGLRCIGVRRPFAFWKNMMECYAQKSTFTTDKFSGGFAAGATINTESRADASVPLPPSLKS